MQSNLSRHIRLTYVHKIEIITVFELNPGQYLLVFKRCIRATLSIHYKAQLTVNHVL